MYTKLTLNIQENTIRNIKKYSKNHRTSISKLVEKYFNLLVESNTSDYNEYISPVVKELSGIINLKNNTDLKDDYSNYLIKKY